MIGASFLLLQALSRQTLRERRVAAIRPGANTEAKEAADDNVGLAVRFVAGIGTLLSRSGILPASTLMELEQTLLLAGMRQRNGLALFVGGKLLLCLLLPVTAYLLLQGAHISPTMRLTLIGTWAPSSACCCPISSYGADGAPTWSAVNVGLPDALDMLVICSEAGLGLEMGLERVANEIEPAHPAIAAELKLTCNELRILADRRVALTNMGVRTKLETLRSASAPP